MDDISRELPPDETGATPVSERQKGPEELQRFELGNFGDDTEDTPRFGNRLAGMGAPFLAERFLTVTNRMDSPLDDGGSAKGENPDGEGTSGEAAQPQSERVPLSDHGSDDELGAGEGSVEAASEAGDAEPESADAEAGQAEAADPEALVAEVDGEADSDQEEATSVDEHEGDAEIAAEAELEVDSDADSEVVDLEAGDAEGVVAEDDAAEDDAAEDNTAEDDIDDTAEVDVAEGETVESEIESGAGPDAEALDAEALDAEAPDAEAVAEVDDAAAQAAVDAEATTMQVDSDDDLVDSELGEDGLPIVPDLTDAAEVARMVYVLMMTSREGMTVFRLARACNTTQKLVEEGLELLQTQLRGIGLPVELTRVGDTVRWMSGASAFPYLQRLRGVKKLEKLSPAALETLAVIAYRQPVMRSEIEAIRGVKAGPMLRTLLQHKLVKVAGRADVPGRPLQYGTTQQFLERFGLASLQELPSVKEWKNLG